MRQHAFILTESITTYDENVRNPQIGPIYARAGAAEEFHTDSLRTCPYHYPMPMQTLGFIHRSLAGIHSPRQGSQTPRPGFSHRLGWELRQKNAMTLFYGHSVTRELVIWREPRYFKRVIHSSYKKYREMKAGGWRTWMGRLGNFPRDGDFLINN